VIRVAALAALAAMAAFAQANVADWNVVKGLAAGTEVRVTIGGRTVHGKVESITDDAVVVTGEKGRESIDRRQVSGASVKKTSHRKRNALIGLAVGTGAGLGVGIDARAKSDQLKVVPNSAVVAAFTAAGALGGLLVGVLIPTGGWREIYRK
jgi:hypothetical protein